MLYILLCRIRSKVLTKLRKFDIMYISPKRYTEICMVGMKWGENMTGEFNNCKNGVCTACWIISPIVVLIGGAAVAVAVNNTSLGILVGVILLVLAILLVFPLRKCDFSADDEKVVFHVAFLKYTYRFSEIESTSSQIGFSHSRHGASARMELVITLSDGECITFYDEDVPDEALSTPENHKTFQDTHQFTALCQYINERASG